MVVVAKGRKSRRRRNSSQLRAESPAVSKNFLYKVVAAAAKPFLGGAGQLPHFTDGAYRVMSVGAHVTVERQGDREPPLGEGRPVTRVVSCHDSRPRLVACRCEKGAVCAMEDVEPEKVLR